MSITVGKSVARVDAFDKVTGRTKYYEDRMPAGALYIRIKHAEIAHGFVKSVDTSAAEAIDGVVKVLTCFDVPDIPFPTAGHPWSMDPGHQDVADRHLLNRHVRYYGDEIAMQGYRDPFNRAFFDWNSTEQRLRGPIKTLAALRRSCDAFDGGRLEIVRAEGDILHYRRVGVVQTAEIILNRGPHLIAEEAFGKNTEVNPGGFTVLVEDNHPEHVGYFSVY